MAASYNLSTTLNKEVQTQQRISVRQSKNSWTLLSRPGESECLFQPLTTLPHLSINKGTQVEGTKSCGLDDMSRSHTIINHLKSSIPRVPSVCGCVRCHSQVSNPRSPSAGCSHWIIQEEAKRSLYQADWDKTPPGEDKLPQAVQQEGFCSMKILLHAGNWGKANYHDHCLWKVTFERKKMSLSVDYRETVSKLS